MIVSRLVSDGRQVVFSGLTLGSQVRRQLEPRCNATSIFDDLDAALEACENSLLGGKPISNNGKVHAPFALSVKQLDVAQALDAAELEYFQKLLVRRQFDAGQCICCKGDAAREIYFLTDGTVSVRLYGSSNSYQRLATLGPGNVFGEVAVIDRGTRSADLWAETPVECFTLALEDFDKLAVDFPAMKIKILEYLLRILTGRLRRANDLIGQLAN